MRLIDCFIEAMAYTSYFLSGLERSQPPFEKVKDDLWKALENGKKLCEKEGFSKEDYKTAKFAVCAWIDEAVLCSEWSGRDAWEKEELQLVNFNTTDAGEEFFERLEHIYAGEMEEQGLNRQVLEVYCTCLALGLRGKYHSVRDRTMLEEVGAEAYRKYMGSEPDPLSEESEARLFPGSHLEDSERGKRKWRPGIRLFDVLMLMIPVAMVIALLRYYNYVLDTIVAAYFNS